jgi:acyl transferase domain-containing protein
MSFLSPSGRCHSFDSRASGYTRSEGIGTLVLKRLSKAIEDGDSIRAVIRATGVNQDGRTMGLTQPSTVAQEALLKKTYADFGLDMSKTRFVEAHGTGTKIGDLSEARALQKSFEGVRGERDPIIMLVCP